LRDLAIDGRRQERNDLHVSMSRHVNRRVGLGAVVAVALGVAVSVALGVVGRTHEPVSQGITLGFGSVLQMKVWFALVVGALAILQGLTALWMYGKLGLPTPRGLGAVHRATGAIAILVSLPVAYNCLWSLGFSSFNTRVLAHSILGCLVYGVFVTKIIALHSRSTPGWLLPLAGGLLFTVIVAVVLTSAVWYVSANGLPTPTSGY
jgi:Family of unknown function (DUF6529)